ncbi:hypothetical protein ACH5RR_030180 [Cinchona calisaya]|uniref:Uncharacterized protein n=1 Tax=Cinchona calisaya TaxID=153742 RepID=A0ABD2YTU8_9GENT
MHFAKFRKRWFTLDGKIPPNISPVLWDSKKGKECCRFGLRLEQMDMIHMNLSDGNFSMINGKYCIWYQEALLGFLRPEENPLDLNNLPEDYYSKDGKQVIEDTSSYAERETETLNHARQLVFKNDTLLGQGALPHHHHLGSQPIPHGDYHQTANISDPMMSFRSVYPTTRLFSGSSTTLLPQPSPQPPYMYSSPSRLIPLPSQYPSDYVVGHVVPGGNITHSSSPNQAGISSNYTCTGAPVIGHGFNTPQGSNNNYGSINRENGTNATSGVVGLGSREMSLYNNHDEGLDCGRISSSCTGIGGTTQKRSDPSSISRFQDSL